MKLTEEDKALERGMASGKQTTQDFERAAFVTLLGHVIQESENMPAALPRLKWMRNLVLRGKHVEFYQGYCHGFSKGSEEMTLCEEEKV